ncbi:hypothetical protein MNBD_NITROSPINAE02-1483 [hydrothermal vent metagenome]|uniref:Uncharacterized protein n=1 Tax=hydrothermal vent metagenome TaxID=652676 RepID=A0A3B1CE09_9ZZZZ
MAADGFSLGRRLYAFGFLALIAVLIAWSAISEYAALSSLQSGFYITSWKKNRGITDDAEFDQALASSRTALILNPYNADYFLEAANLYEWGAIRYPAWTPQAHKFRGKAIDNYRRSVTLRPSWGYAWAHLSHSKILDQQFDDETFIAFERAMIMAPWATDVQRKVVWSGFVMWEFLPPEQKDLFLETIKRVLKTPYQIKYLSKMAVHAGWEKNLWPLINNESDKRHLEEAVARFNKKRKR